MLHRLSPERRALAGQIIRYGVTGVGVTALQGAIFSALVYLAHFRPLTAHFAASAVAVAVGYVVHSRYSFRGHGEARGAAAFGRFLLVSLLGIGLNSLWVWLLTGPLGLPAWTVNLAYLFVTPPIVFVFNRLWVFR
jgi:putative flippase GtrA